jgi:aspartyl-tRNA(Asn)/glutamyl-tRNA(Gln) amidotransferase subunit C
VAQNPWLLYPAGRMADPSARARELAALAHLELSEAEAAIFGAQLETILGYLRRLQAVDVDEVPEYLSNPPEAKHSRAGLREDEAGPSFDADRALAAAPALRERLIAVPNVMQGRIPG